MALSAPPTPLVIAMTQGSGDAFVQGSVLTGLSGRQAYNLRALFFEFVPAAWTFANGQDLSLAVTRRSKTAMPTLTDPDVIWMRKFRAVMVTSGAIFFQQADSYVFPQEEVPIVEDTLYAQMDSTSLTNAWSSIIRLDVELDTISDIDRLNLITRSLS